MIAKICLIAFISLGLCNMSLCLVNILSCKEWKIKVLSFFMSVLDVVSGASLHYLYFIRHIYSLTGTILACILLLIETGRQLSFIRKWKKSHLGSDAVKELFNRLDVGLCYYLAESGKIILCNNLMLEIGEKLLGYKPRDGRELLAFHPRTLRVGEKTYRFQANELEVRNHKLIEITAYDLSKQEELRESLSKENQKLEKVNMNLRKYLGLVDKITREKEILRTKEIIHANFGRLLLSSVRALEQEAGQEELLTILDSWKNTLTLMEIDTDAEDDLFKELLDTAQSVDVKIHIKGNLPPKGTMDYEVIVRALSECLTNTVEHADGHNMYVSIYENGTEKKMIVSNDGASPQPGSREGGGLSSLRQRVEASGGIMEVRYQPSFQIKFTKYV